MIDRMGDIVIPEALEFATRLAAGAGERALKMLGRGTVSRKADDSVVTDTDRALQAYILEAVAHRYPDHAFLAEETLPPAASHRAARPGRYTWVVDPLDGTRNYVSGLPCFATSIAVLDEGQPIIGVVHEHNLRQLYTARLGEGATLDGQPIRCSDPPPDYDWLIGVPSTKDPLSVRVLQRWVATPGFVCRNLGSAAFHLALVSSGALTGAFSKQAKIWDLAAGLLFVTEAGGRITDPLGGELLPLKVEADSNEDTPFLAAPPTVHEQLLRTIRSAAL